MTKINKGTLISMLIAFSLTFAACGTTTDRTIASEEVERSSVGASTPSTSRSTTTTTEETTTSESTTTTSDFPDRFGGVVEVNTIEDFETSFAWLVEEENKDRTNDLYADLPQSQRGDFESLTIAYYPVSDGIFFGASHDEDDVVTAYGLFFDPDDANFAQFMSIFLTLTLPSGGSSFSDKLTPFMNDTAEDILKDEVGGFLVEVERAGSDPVSDPIFVLSILAESSSMVHLDITRSVAQAASENLESDDDDISGDEADEEPVSRERALERDVTVDSCDFLSNGGVALVGSITNNGTIRRGYLIRVLVTDPFGEVSVPGAFGTTLDPGETWPFEESLSGSNVGDETCGYELADPEILGAEEFPS